MIWSEELWNVVKQLWEEGKTGGEICRLIPGLNRNSVMGRLFRHRRDGEIAYRKPRAMTGPSIVHRRNPYGRGPMPLRYPLRVDMRNKRPDDAIPFPFPSTSQRSFNSISGPSYDLQDLGMFECHWPIGDPNDPNFCYCAAPVRQRPYCPHHTQIAYVGR